MSEFDGLFIHELFMNFNNCKRYFLSLIFFFFLLSYGLLGERQSQRKGLFILTVSKVNHK